MGCSSGRFGSEESSLAAKQLPTGFEAHSTLVSLNCIFRYTSYSAPLTSSQFTSISSALHLVSSLQFDVILRNWLLEKRISTLVVLAILLSKDSNHAKATSLFETFDPSARGQMEESKLSELLTELFQVACKVLKVLYVGLDIGDEQYFERLERSVPMARTQAKVMLMPRTGALPKDSFVERMCEYEAGMLLSPAGLRKYLRDQTPLVKPLE
jgi:hypothetical protein